MELVSLFSCKCGLQNKYPFNLFQRLPLQTTANVSFPTENSLRALPVGFVHYICRSYCFSLEGREINRLTKLPCTFQIKFPSAKKIFVNYKMSEKQLRKFFSIICFEIITMEFYLSCQHFYPVTLLLLCQYKWWKERSLTYIAEYDISQQQFLSLGCCFSEIIKFTSVSPG